MKLSLRTTADTYKLQAGDYTIENNSANVGDYIVKLTNTGFAHLNAGIAKYAGAGNVTLGEDNLKGQASFTIKQKDLTVTLDKKPNTIPGKTYDGDPATIDDNDAQLTADGLVIGESLNTANLTPSDYEWVDENGKKLDKIPTDAGTYYIALTQAGKDQLQKDNPNYNVSESGKFAYVISPKKVDVTVQGGQESTDTAINNGKFSLNVPAGVTIPNGMTYDFANGTPTESGVYQVALSPTSQTALKNANPNYTLNIKPGGKFTLDATVTFTFQDTDENNKQVGDVVTKTGVAGSIAKNLGLSVPAGYELATGESLPSDYTFGKTLQQTVFIKLTHIKKTIEHTDPVPEDGKTPTGKPIDGAHEDDLNQTITRTINVKNPDGTTDTTTQTAHIYRDASYDDVTGDVTYGTWSEDSTNWKKFTTPTIDGYTPSKETVPAITVKDGQKNVTIIITYSPVEQTGKISYQDKDGNEIGTSPLKGKTDEPIKVDPTKDVPAGWEIVPDQDIPKTVTATPDGIPTVIVKIQHKKVTVTPETPEGKIPTGKVPGDPAKTYPKLQDLTKKPTRTITIIKPDGTKGVVSQEVTFTRTATFDEVTGDVTYTDWKFKDSNASDTTKSQWDAYTPAAISGYTADPASVAAKAVSVDTGNVEITIIYKPIGGGGDDQPEGPDTPPATNPGPTEPGNGGQPTTAPTTPPVPGKPGDTTGKPSLPNVPGTTPGIKPKPELKPIKPIKTVKKSKITTKVQAEDTVRKNAPAKPNNVTDNAPLHMDQAAAPKGANVANVKKNALPQTGEKHEENSMGWLGSLLASLGLFSLIGAKKRKKRDAE
ncbi:MULTISPECIES: MBG domain-containing protein [Lactobacillus]|uniref:mucin-binding protein n=1 Tax=Lactobacillus TaxID=1578 RepID=UPI001374829A|nr:MULTISPECIES: MBG domain-containing protein [Lactobacillus]